MKFLSRYTHAIFLILGYECNLNCRYCLQHPLVHNQISHKINPDIYDFIEEAAFENNNKKIKLRFFGGEATLFFDNIKEIVTEIEKRRLNISWSIISNGKSITQEMVDFFNKYNFHVDISHDGYNVLKTRGYDPFNDEEHKKLLFQINKLGILAVLSSFNSPKKICAALQKLDDEYKNIHKHHLYIEIDDIFDTGGLDKDLLNIDYNKVMSEIEDMTKEYIQDRVDGFVPEEHYVRNTYIHTMYRSLSGFYLNNQHNKKFILCNCKNGLSILNLGIDGTLYPCHNTSEKIGTIYDGYFTYLENLMKFDNTKHYYEETCKDCSVLAFCNCGCKMVKDKEREESYCKIKTAIYLPMLKTIQKFNEYGYIKREA